MRSKALLEVLNRQIINFCAECLEWSGQILASCTDSIGVIVFVADTKKRLVKCT